jgi:class 3 adenylate cyclase
MKAQAIQYSLEGMIDPAKLQNIVNSSETFKIEPKNQVLTVMFIDIAGFSALAEKETPTEVFNHLRNLMTSISDIVHKNGGIIDRSLGDGLLCFFGYRFEEGDLQDHSHIRQAVDCAVEIQKMALQNGHAALKNKQPIFPLRIGLNTGEVYAGDIGGSHKIDFTIIGHAVNFAQRMESACENYKIMCGAATFDNLQFDENLRTKFSEKLISIKHYKNLVKAYEIDPFGGDEQSQQDCEELRRAFDKNTRAEERINVPLSWGLTVQAESDIKGQVVNFSKSGFEVIFNKYLGRSAGLSLNLSSELTPITEYLKNNYLDQITVEVRWSMQTGSNRYKTGVKFKNLSENQKEVLLNFLKSNLDDGLPDQGLKS